MFVNSENVLEEANLTSFASLKPSWYIYKSFHFLFRGWEDDLNLTMTFGICEAKGQVENRSALSYNMPWRPLTWPVYCIEMVHT